MVAVQFEKQVEPFLQNFFLVRNAHSVCISPKNEFCSNNLQQPALLFISCTYQSKFDRDVTPGDCRFSWGKSSSLYWTSPKIRDLHKLKKSKKNIYEFSVI